MPDDTELAAARAAADVIAAKARAGQPLTPAEVAQLPKLEAMLRTDAHKPPEKPSPGKSTNSVDSPARDAFQTDRVPIELTARIVGQTRKTLENWFRDGAPRNPDKTFDLPALIAWRIARADAAAREKPAAARRWQVIDEKHKALKRLDATRARRNEWCPIGLAAQVITECQERTRVRIGRLARELPASFTAEQKIAVTKLVERALTELAESEWSKLLRDAQPTNANDGATTTPDSSPPPKKRSARRKR